MSKYILGKAGQYALILFIALLINFALPRLLPGDPLIFLAGEDVALLSTQEKNLILHEYGLDRPLADQFVIYVSALLHGDLGFSFRFQRPVASIVMERLPWTLLLVGTAILIATVLGVAAGTLAAWKRGSRSDVGTLAVFMFLDSMPSFWLGTILIIVFSVHLRLLPVFGAIPITASSSGLGYAFEILKRLILPLSTLSLVSAGGMFLTARYSLLGVIGEDYILMAKAKGIGERNVLFRHALRNSLLPVLTVLMLNLGHITGGATVVETVFSYPGLGRLMFDAVLSRDYPLIQGAFLLFTVTVITANLVADLLYPLLDPRVRRAEARY